MKNLPRLSTMITAVAAAIVLAAPPWILHHSGDAGFGPVLFVFSGRAFASRPLVIGGALDQFTLHKEWFLFCYSLVVLCPCLAVVRWITIRSQRMVRRTFVILLLVMLLHPVSILTIFTYDVSRYIFHMGVTRQRLYGLAAALLAALALALFAAWLSGHSMQTIRRWCRTRRGLCPECGYDLRASTGRCPECGARDRRNPWFAQS